MGRAEQLRAATLAVAAAASLAAGWAFLDLIGGNRPTALDWMRGILLTMTVFWLLWGGLTGILGAFAPVRKPSAWTRPKGMTAVLVPIYNEDPVETFARIAAMNRHLVELGLADRFHFAILSDSTALDVAAEEAAAFELLLREPQAAGRIFYRRRERNVGRKAGNIEDFIARSGGAYDYALILDADSLMEAGTMAAMAARMDQDSRLGLLQTVPEVIGAHTVFARMMAFSSSYLSPYFARGMALLQGEQGPYWGHNAIVRMKAFAQCCGLPVLSGKPPYGGHILSHDYVEAALLARGGWKVEVDPELGGSFEHGPENMVEHAKRDRRWCQGNLQHRRLVFAPGLKMWSRFTFVQGIMAYAVSPLWLALLATSILATVFPDRGGIRWDSTPLVLGLGVAGALLLPKLAIVIRGALDGHNRRFGGNLQVALSVLAEVVLSTLIAPVLLAFQSRAVIQILLGLDGGWPATERDARRVPLRTAFRTSWWISLLGLVAIAAMTIAAPRYVAWLLPVAAPAVLAPVIIWATSLGDGGWARGRLFTSRAEHAPSPVMAENIRILASWRNDMPLETGAAMLEKTHAPA